jgi:hypothetical protein
MPILQSHRRHLKRSQVKKYSYLRDGRKLEDELSEHHRDSLSCLIEKDTKAAISANESVVISVT